MVGVKEMVYIPIGLRVALIAGSLMVLIFIIYSSIKSKMDIHYSVLWTTMAFIILLIGIWPGLAAYLGEAIGFQSVSNFIFLIMIAVLFLLNYYSFLTISKLNENIRKLNYKVASLQKQLDQESKKQDQNI